MAQFSKHKLSGSTGGKPIDVVATATPGTTIHSEPSGRGVFDEIWLYAFNPTANDRLLTVEWGDVGAANELKATVKSRSGLYVVAPGLLIDNEQLDLTGTIAATNGAKTIMGTGTAFTSQLVVGDYIQVGTPIGSAIGKIFAVSNDAEVVLEENFTGTTVAGVVGVRLRLRPIRAYADAGNAVSLTGWVNRIAQ